MTIKHNAKGSYYLVDGKTKITYDPTMGFEAKREAWQFALELVAAREAKASVAHTQELAA